MAASSSFDNTQVAEDTATQADLEVETTPAGAQPSTTVGTGSYVAVTCVVMMVLLTLLLIAGLLVSRWLF